MKLLHFNTIIGDVPALGAPNPNEGAALAEILSRKVVGMIRIRDMHFYVVFVILITHLP